jgi:hypothetical protein
MATVPPEDALPAPTPDSAKRLEVEAQVGHRSRLKARAAPEAKAAVAISVVLLAGLVGAAVVWRDQVMAYWPNTGHVFRLLGLE